MFLSYRYLLFCITKLTAVLSTSLFIITGIASLPSVGHSMNKAQFMFVYGQIVWAALGLGVLHVSLFQGFTVVPCLALLFGALISLFVSLIIDHVPWSTELDGIAEEPFQLG
jgi:hypothetical protein